MDEFRHLGEALQKGVDTTNPQSEPIMAIELYVPSRAKIRRDIIRECMRIEVGDSSLY